MALQVWLPLLGDTHNQGVSGIDTFGTPSSWVDGKLGKCAHFAGNAANVIYNNTSEFNYTDNFSFAFWINYDYTSGSSQATQYAFTVGRADMGGYGYGCQIISTSQVRLRFGNQSMDLLNFPEKEWHHIAVTIKDSKMSLYRDGSFVATTTVGALPTYSDGNGMGIGCFHYTGNIYPYNGDMCDFRIYNHCLSPKEVKLLSQGLVAHYQLNDGYLEPTTNMTNVRYVGADSSSGWGGHTSVTTVINCQDAPIPYDACSKIAVTYSGSGGGGVGRFIQRVDVSPNTTYTYSGYIKTSNNFGGSNLANMLYRYEYNSSGTNIYEVGVFDVSRRISLGDGWYRCWGTFTTKDTTASIAIYFFVYPYADVDYYVGCWQLEQKDHLTPYVFGTRSETTVYDSSGFNNHMIAVGNPTVSSDSIRSSVSTCFINGQYALAQQNANLYLPKDSITVSLWIKCSTWGNPISCTEGGGWNFEDIGSGLQFPAYISGVGYKIANSGLSPSTLLNAWHMLTGTFDGTTLKIYVDAQLKGTTSTGTTNPIGYAANRLVISGEAQGATPASSTYVGNISDVRIYATALSAEDIQALYNAPVSIANNGTMITQGEFVEV